MFKKVLVAEDMDSISEGLNSTLQSMGITNIHHAKYCDDAFLKIKKAKQDHEPFDLLISDLSFVEDHRKQQLTTGDDLALAVKKELPKVKTIIYSIEDRKQRIKNLINKVGVDAFVCKGRNGLTELTKAVEVVYNNKSYISEEIAHKINNKAIFEITDYDVKILKYLSKGYNHNEISEIFKTKNIKPFSLSTLEKRINKLKIFFKAKNSIHLIALTKDTGLI
jgi:DNA-binding NarL/FixJ family response regulator